MSGHSNENFNSKELWGGGRSPFGVTYGKMMMWFFLVSDALTFSGLLIAYGMTRAASTSEWPVAEQVFRALPGLEGEYPLIYVALMTFILIVSSVTMVLAVEAGHRNDKKGVIKWMVATIIGGVIFLGSQAWEWSHFIHGGGGHFNLVSEVTVIDDHGEAHTLEAGTPIYMDHHFGDLAMAYDEGDGSVELHENNEHINFIQYGEHSHEAEMHSLTVNKYITGETHVSGEEAVKLWNARDKNLKMVFGANMHDNEYGIQQSYANFFFFITGFHGFHVFSGVVINIIIFLMALKGVFERRGHYEMVEKTGLYWHFVDLVWVFVFTFFYLI
jgi:cytochrome c oxidase subunit 3